MKRVCRRPGGQWLTRAEPGTDVSTMAILPAKCLAGVVDQIKMSLDRVILVAGPSCAGKSLLIDRILSGRSAALADVLRIENPQQWDVRGARFGVDGVLVSSTDRVILHYDLNRRHGRRRGFAEDPVLKAVMRSPSVSVVTTWASPEVLLDRAKARRRALFEHRIALRKLPRLLFRRRWLARLERIYAKRGYVGELYDRWWSFVGSMSVDENLVVDANGAASEAVTYSAWRAGVGRDEQIGLGTHAGC